MSPSESFGTFHAAVFTADRALPVEGAEVLIYERDENVPLFRLVTDESGLTESVLLRAPPAADSQVPGTSLPYADYRVSVTALGYYPLSVLHLPIFDKVESTLPAALIPLSAYRSQSFVPLPETRTVSESPQVLGKEKK